MLINLLEFRNEYCILDYSLAKENLELIGINHWLNELYKEYNIGKFKKIFGSDCFSKHIKFLEINKIPDINLKSQNIFIDWIDICGYNEDGYIVEPEGNNSFFILSIRGELIFDIPQKVLIEWSDIKKNQDIAKNEALKFNRDKFYSWHHKETIYKDGSASYEGGDDIWGMLDYWLAIKTDDPKIDCFTAWDGGIDDFKYEILEENIEDAISLLNLKNLD